VLNYISHHENVQVSAGITPHIPNLSTRWRWIVSFISWLLYPSGTPLIWGLVGPSASLDAVGKKNIPATAWNQSSVTQPTV